MSLVRSDALILPFADGTFQCAITSPPYFGKVTYGDSDAEHGRGSLASYVTDIGIMAEEVARVTDDRAVFWLNLGDTMANSGGAGGDYNAGGRKDWKPKAKQGDTRLLGKQHCLVPQRVALHLQDKGHWQVKRWIVWDKSPVVRPEDVNHVKRPLDAHEVILMLIKPQPKRGPATYRYRPHAHKHLNIGLGDVWHFTPERKRTGHQAPYPEELPRRCILLSTEQGDRVLDPYVGSGTTTRVANELGRVGIGTDLYAGTS
jgi:site-specific DNA-methyltransferase (cytosine-N4-specific)